MSIFAGRERAYPPPPRPFLLLSMANQVSFGNRGRIGREFLLLAVPSA